MIWDDIEEVEVDQEEVEDLFEDKKKVKLDPTASPTKTKKGMSQPTFYTVVNLKS